MVCVYIVFFFKQKTAYEMRISDWSSDVCSSDLMTHGFPNQFYIGYIQGGLNASVTEQFGEQGRHIAYIISEALKRGVKSVEPSQAAQDEYVRRFEELEIDLSEFQDHCPPGYFTNEGEHKPKWGLFRGWGHGWDAFQQMVGEWRGTGEREGLVGGK